jgi:hypothetical protein
LVKFKKVSTTSLLRQALRNHWARKFFAGRTKISQARASREEGETMTEHTEPTAAWAESFKLMIERGGGTFVGIRAGAILFRGGPDEPICSLYPFALRSTIDVELAIKSARERKKAAQWEFEEAARPIS